MTDQTTTDNQTRPAALDQEYVVGSGFWWYRGQSSRALALPWAIDDVSRDFGDDIYDRMEDDSQIAASDTLLRASIVEEGVTLSPAIDDRDGDGYQQAVELVAFCEPQLDDLETSLDDVLWDMMGCFGRGNRIAEITYHPFDASPLPGRAVLQSLVVKPRESTAFVVDAYMRTIGIMGRQLGQPMAVMPGALIDPADARVIDREKFAVATFRPKNNDPRGTSGYRPAYSPWWLKMQALEDFRKYLAQFATPLLVGIAPPGTNKVVDSETGDLLSPVQAMLKQLLLVHNSTAIALANGSLLNLLFSTGEGKAFLHAFSLYNQEITKAITTQTLATSEGEHASRAQAGVHQDALGTIVRQAKRGLCRMLRRDVLRNLVRYNYGDNAIPLTPKVSLGEAEAEDIAKLMTAVAQLQGSTYIHESQLAGIDRMLNLPARVIAPGETATSAQPPATQNPPPPPPPPGGGPGQQQGGGV